MKASQIWMAALILSVCMAAFATAPARADDTKVAVCDPLKAVTTCKEFKDYQGKTSADHKAYEGQHAQRVEELTSTAAQLRMLVADSPEYDKLNGDYLKKSIEFKVWEQVTELELSRKEKTTLKAIFDKMQAKVGEVAQKKGISLVIADRHADLPEDMAKMDMNQFFGVIMERSVLFKDPKLDITDEVILALDAAYAK